MVHHIYIRVYIDIYQLFFVPAFSLSIYMCMHICIYIYIYKPCFTYRIYIKQRCVSSSGFLSSSCLGEGMQDPHMFRKVPEQISVFSWEARFVKSKLAC